MKPTCETCGAPMRAAGSNLTVRMWVCAKAENDYRAARDAALEAVDAAFDLDHLRTVTVPK